MNYAIEEYVFNDYNASSKARKDISYFVHQFGFKTLIKNDKSQKRYGKLAKSLKAFQVFAKVFSLSKNDVLFIQTSHLLLNPILCIKKIRKFKVIYLIHDVFSLRYNTEQSIREHRNEIERDINLLNGCDCVIAHNQIMINRLKDFGCNTLLISLDIFDYACTYPVKKRLWNKAENIEIAFAGNLAKSNFLKELDKKNPQFKVNVYGTPQTIFQHINYKGCVDADLLPNVIEGHFGLIWEGGYNVKIEDNYNLINNPHKLSMYIVSGLPIIVLKDSAAGKFVEKEKIGFTINSLDEISHIINELSENEYNAMVNKCINIRNKIITGFFLHSALEKFLATTGK